MDTFYACTRTPSRKLLAIFILSAFFLINMANALAATSIKVPPGIQYYLPITVTNYQGTAVAANTPIAIGTNFIGGNALSSANTVMTGFNAVAYQQYETCNLNNAEFFLGNGTVLNSWMEGNVLAELVSNPACTSASSANALASSANVLYWVKIPTNTFLPANTGTATTNTIYLGWAGNVISPANNLLTDGAGAGEAPTLSTGYGQYDNGANVFSSYFNGDTPASGFKLGSNNQQQQVTGITIGSDTNANVLYLTGYGTDKYNLIYDTPIPNGNYVVESNYYPENGLANNQGVLGLTDTPTAVTNGNALAVNMGYASTYFGQTYVSDGTATTGLNRQGTSESAWLFATANYTQTSATWEGFTAPQLYSATGGYSGSTENHLGNAVDVYLASLGSDLSSYPDYMYYNWMRARLSPPNGVMPATTSYGSITQSCAAYLSPSNAIVDVGQYVTLTVSEGSCISTYTYNILVSNSITPSAITYNDLITGSSATYTSYTFQTVTADTSNSPEEANVVVTDSGTNTVTSIYSKLTINPDLSGISLTSSQAQPNSLETGATITFTASFSGGSSPYAYDYLITNTITGTIVANVVYGAVAGTSNSFAWTVPSNMVGNTLQANVIVTDSATTPETINSVKSGTITITSGVSAGAITPANPTIDFGQNVTLTANPTSGTTPYKYKWYVGASCTTLISGQTGSTYTFVPTIASSYSYQVNDSASPASTACSAADTVTINPSFVQYTSNALYFGVYSYSIYPLELSAATNSLYLRDGNPTITIVNLTKYTKSSISNKPYGLFSMIQGGQPAYVLFGYNVTPINTISKTTGTPVFITKNTLSDIILSPNGKMVYVTTNIGCCSTEYVYAYNISTNTVGNAIAIGYGNGPSSHQLAVSPNGNYLYVGQGADIYTVNLATNTVTNTIATPFSASLQLSLSLDGNTIYAYGTPSTQGEVLPINMLNDTAENAIYTKSKANTTAVAFSPNGSILYAGENDGSIVMVNALTHSTEGTIYTATNEIHSINMSVNGSTLYAGGSGEIFTITPTTTFNPRNVVLDSGQDLTLSLSWNGGTPGYTPKLYSSASATCNAGSTLVQTLSSTSAENTIFTVSPASDIYYCSSVTDSAYSPQTVLSGTSNIIVNPALTSTMGTSNGIVDLGQAVTLSSSWSGGTAPYTIKWYTGPSGNTCAEDSANILATYSGLSSTSNGILVNPTTTNSYCIGITDSATTPVTALSSNFVVTVNPALTIPALTASNTPTVDAGQYEVFTASWSGGTTPYAANYQVFNTITDALLANAFYTGITGTSNTFLWLVPNADSGNTISANVFITDSASVPVTANSVVSNTIIIPSTSTTSTSTTSTTTIATTTTSGGGGGTSGGVIISPPSTSASTTSITSTTSTTLSTSSSSTTSSASTTSVLSTSVSTTAIAITSATTTIKPVAIVKVATVSEGIVTKVNFTDYNLTVALSTSSNKLKHIAISLYAQTTANMTLKNYTGILSLFLNESSSEVSMNVTIEYNCKYGSEVVPFAYINDSWNQIYDAVILQSPCRIVFPAPNKHTIGLFVYNNLGTMASSTATSYTTAITINSARPAVQEEYYVIGAVVVAMAIIVYLFVKRAAGRRAEKTVQGKSNK